MVPFAGWEMPVPFEGILEEHSAVRTHAGIFDVSHMGEVEVQGRGRSLPPAGALNDVSKIALGGAQYQLPLHRVWRGCR